MSAAARITLFPYIGTISFQVSDATRSDARAEVKGLPGSMVLDIVVVLMSSRLKKASSGHMLLLLEFSTTIGFNMGL